ncbi:MAG TPA: hypothetical protein PK819_05760, partial [Thermomicrobiales bacterium]|nr:hypothetical protein [Thermomicrobiales bacterium]
MEKPHIEHRRVDRHQLNAVFASMVAHYDKQGIKLIRRRVYENPSAQSSGQPPGTMSIVEKWIDPETEVMV